MEKDILIYARITEYLSLLTENNSFGHSNSKGIENYDDLADELNTYPLISFGRIWSPHSLECFFSRIRKKYVGQNLRSITSKINTGLNIDEFHFHKADMKCVDTRSPEENRRRIATLQEAEQASGQFLTKWKKFEQSEMITDQKYLFRIGVEWLHCHNIKSEPQVSNNLRMFNLSEYLVE